MTALTLLQPWTSAGPKILEKLVSVVQSMTMLLFPVLEVRFIQCISHTSFTTIFFVDTLAAGAIVGIVFAVLILLCIIIVIVIAIILVFCTGVCACCVAARSIRSNRTAAEVNINVTGGTKTSAPPPSYSQSTAVIQQQSSAYSAPDTGKTGAQFIQPQPLAFGSFPAGPEVGLEQHPPCRIVDPAHLKAQVTAAT